MNEQISAPTPRGSVEVGPRQVQVIGAHPWSRGVGPGRMDVAVCGAGRFLVERRGRGSKGDPFGRCPIEVAYPRLVWGRN